MLFILTGKEEKQGRGINEVLSVVEYNTRKQKEK